MLTDRCTAQVGHLMLKFCRESHWCSFGLRAILNFDCINKILNGNMLNLDPSISDLEYEKSEQKKKKFPLIL